MPMPATAKELQDGIAKMLQLEPIGDVANPFLYEIANTGLHVNADFFSNAVIHMRCIEILKISVSWVEWHRGIRSPGWMISSKAMPKGCVNPNLASGMLVVIYKSLCRISGPGVGDGAGGKFDSFVAAMLSGLDLKTIRENWPDHDTDGVAAAPAPLH